MKKFFYEFNSEEQKMLAMNAKIDEDEETAGKKENYLKFTVVKIT